MLSPWTSEQPKPLSLKGHPDWHKRAATGTINSATRGKSGCPLEPIRNAIQESEGKSGIYFTTFHTIDVGD